MIQVEEARQFFEANGALFIDARSDYDFKLGHIKGAFNLPLPEFDQKKNILSAIPKDKLLITYCNGTGCNSSIELSVKLALAGFTNVRIFYGGWKEWEAMKLPTEHEEQRQ